MAGIKLSTSFNAISVEDMDRIVNKGRSITLTIAFSMSSNV